jgi:TPR repeat protein
VGYLMDRFRAKGPGLVLVHGGGNVFERRLAPNEMILVKPTALLFKDSSVAMQLHSERVVVLNQSLGGLQRYLWLRLFGPGRVVIQSAFDFIEDRESVSSCSPMTERQLWAFGDTRRWNWAEGGETRGPVRTDQLQGLIDVGRLSQDVPVWTDGMKSWIAASLVGKGLRRPIRSWAGPTPTGARVAKTANCFAVSLILAVFVSVFAAAFFVPFFEGRAQNRRAAATAKASQAACDHGDLAACFALSTQYWWGRGIPKDQAKALALRERACGGNHVPACLALGDAYRASDGIVPKDPAKAALAYARACDLRDTTGCLSAANVYRNGEALANPARMAEYQAQACEAGDSNSCATAGYALMEGEGGVPKDERRAFALFRRGCDAHEPWACGNLGYMLEGGKGVRADPAAARRVYQETCDRKDAYSCTNLAVLLEAGEGGGKDPSKAETLLQWACGANFPRGCYELGLIYRDGLLGVKDPAKAAPFLAKACDAKYQKACEATGRH